MRFFEDFVPGESEIVGVHRLTSEEIVGFARQWDPQPMHVDAAAAATTAFGGLIASGVHVIAISVRLLVTGGAEPVAAIAGLGWDNVRFLAPVRPGDTLTLSRRCIETRRSASKPDRGIVRNALLVTNQSGDAVLSYDDRILVRARPETSAS